MKFSKLFTKTRKEAPKDEVAKNARLLIQAGFIHKELAGVYSYLPLGLRVLNKIENIIREEMNAIGGEEVLLTAIQNPELWRKTDRWEQDVWFKTQLNIGTELGFGWTQEEEMTHIMSQYIHSYKDLPKYAYQIQTKFRNEERAKSGIIRGREFKMKDLYSFHASTEDLDSFYECAKEAYRKVFERVGLGELTFLTFASGGAFSKYSHEFQTLSDAGEDTIYLSPEKKIAVNEEVYSDDVLEELKLEKKTLERRAAIEVGNIFKLGTRFSEPLGLFFKDADGNRKPVVMGSYGIGPSRVMGTIAEALSDDKGLVWPSSVAPSQVHLISLGDTPDVREHSQKLYDMLYTAGIEALFDDRNDAGAGEKFADADLIGIPYRVIVSGKTLADGAQKAEIRGRKEKDGRLVDFNGVVREVSQKS